MKPAGLLEDSPNRFTLKQRSILALGAPLAAKVYQGLGMSCRAEVIGQEHWDAAVERGRRILVGAWHESLGLCMCLYRNKGYYTLTSYSFDGELAARVVRGFGLHAVRGSSSRGGFRALGELKKALEQSPMVGLTLDGPRGPRRVAKPGIAIVAAQTGVPILPLAAIARPCWHLRSWDRFAIPKPFGKITYAYAAPIAPPADCSTDCIEATRRQVEDALNALYRQLEETSAISDRTSHS